MGVSVGAPQGVTEMNEGQKQTGKATAQGRQMADAAESAAQEARQMPVLT